MKSFKKISALLSAVIVSAASISSLAVGVSATDEPPYTAYLCISAGGNAQWAAGEWETEVASITENGSYSTSVVIEGGSENIDFLMLSTDINAYAFAPEVTSNPIADGSVSITIDSIEIERTSGTTDTIAYNGPSENALYLNDDGSTIRVNILNTWSPTQITEDIDSVVEGGLAEGDKLIVSFTVSGLPEPVEASYGDIDANGRVDADDAYLALKEYATASVGGASTLDETQQKFADVSGDGNINADDAYLILVYYAQQSVGSDPTPFPATQA